MAMNNTTTSSISTATLTSSAHMTSFVTNMSSPIFIALAVVTIILQKLMKQQSKDGKGAVLLPPGPKPLPVIGCLHLMLRNKPAFQWIHTVMSQLNTGIACFRFGSVNVITVTSLEVAQEFLHKQDGTFSDRPVHMSTELPTYGYKTVALTPYGKQWKKMRRIVTSEVLSVQRHRWLQDKRTEEADNLIGYLYSLCNQQNGDGSGSHLVDIRTVTQHYCGNVIRKLMLNKRCFGQGVANGGPAREEIEHVDALFKILNYINAFSVSDYLPFLRVFDLDGHEAILQNALKTIRKYNDPVIDERIQMWRNGTKDKNDEPQDILDVLIQLTDESNDAPLLSSDEIKAQILDLMLAAVDNPSNATEWALAEMINQPKMLQRAIEEIDGVVGKHRLVQESDLPKLNYVKACAREAFRLHPVSAFNVPHVANADTRVAGYSIPKGSHLLISRITLGRNPKVWEDPDMFKPERHLNPDGSEVVLADPKLHLLSFSTGRRGCPGVLLGSTMTAMLLARLLQGFTWDAPPNVPTSSLIEVKNDLFFARPLVAVAKPRLPEKVYPTN